jgi:hypothetical protein
MGVSLGAVWAQPLCRVQAQSQVKKKKRVGTLSGEGQLTFLYTLPERALWFYHAEVEIGPAPMESRTSEQ